MRRVNRLAKVRIVRLHRSSVDIDCYGSIYRLFYRHEAFFLEIAA